MTPRLSTTRVLQVHNRYRQAGGEDAVVEAQRRLLSESGHEVRQLEFSNPSGTLASATQLLAAPWNPMAARRARAEVDSWRPQLAHIHNTWFSATPSVVAALDAGGLPMVMTLHNYRLTCINAQLLRDGGPCTKCVGRSPWTGVIYRCYRDSYLASTAAAATLALNRRMGTHERAIDRYLVFTEFQKDLMVDAGLPAEKLEIVPNFVSDPGPRINDPGESDVVAYVGRLSPEKGVDRLIDAWEATQPASLRLVVVGDGPLLGPLRERQVPGVEFKGRMTADQVRTLMLSSRALAYPSICYEGQPLVLLEALAAGLPIMAPDHGGVGATLEGVCIGMTRNWETTLAELSTLGTRQLAVMGEKARRRYLEHFTPEIALTGLERAYRHVLEGAGA